MDADLRVRTIGSTRVLVGTSVSVVIVVVAIFCFWITHPGVVGEYEGGQGLELSVGDTLVADSGVYTVSGDDLDDLIMITVGSAVPRVSENSADADIELVLCRLLDSDSRIGSIPAEELTSYCAEEIPVTGAYESLPLTAQLLLRITPRQAGTVLIEGIDLTYRQGIRRATVHAGLETVVTAT